MTVSYRMSWSGGFDNPTILEVITVEKYRCLGPVNIGQDLSGEIVWWMDTYGDGRFDPESSKPVCESVEEMLEKGWIEEASE